MKSIAITDEAHKNLSVLKDLLKERSAESIGQIVGRLVKEEIGKVEEENYLDKGKIDYA